MRSCRRCRGRRLVRTLKTRKNFRSASRKRDQLVQSPQVDKCLSPQYTHGSRFSVLGTQQGPQQTYTSVLGELMFSWIQSSPMGRQWPALQGI